MMENENESALVERCMSGDETAWDTLFNAHYDAAMRFVFQLSSDLTHEDAEEIVQESFTSLIHGLRSFRGGSSLRTWLFRIAGNKARDYLAKRHAAKRGGGAVTLSLHADEESGAVMIDPPSSGRSPAGSAEINDDCRLVQEALSRLGGFCRELIELRYFGDLSYEEISATLKMNMKTVSSRLSRCLDRLAAIYREQENAGRMAQKPSNSKPTHFDAGKP